MSAARIGLALSLVLFVRSAPLHAKVMKEELIRFKLEGALGKMVGMFSKADNGGESSTVWLQGSKRMTRTGERGGQLIDLDAEKIYDIDFKKKEYTVMTFEEMRQQMRDAAERMKEMSKEPGEEPAQEPTKEMEIDFDIKESGNTRAINGFDSREVVATVTVREKDKTLEQSGGMVLTSNMWLTERIAALDELMEFDRKFIAKLDMTSTLAAGLGDSMALLTGRYPKMQEAMAKLEAADLKGTPVLTELQVVTVRSPEQLAQAQKQDEGDGGGVSVGGGLRGGLGGLGAKLAKKKTAKEPEPRQLVFTSGSELRKLSAEVADADVAIPAGFEQKERKKR